MEKTVVVGGGLVGALQAIYLAKRGYQVDVYERRSDLRTAKIIAGKSINLALSDRGWKALERAGISDDIKEISIPMYGRMMHSVTGELTYQPYGKEGQAIYSVSRGELNRKLLQCADKYDNVSLYFDKKCLELDLDENELEFENLRTGEIKHVKADRIYGTDGAFSAVRMRMMKTDRFDYSQTYLKEGYKELLIPANEDGTHKLDKNCLHIWPRGAFMLIALANLDGSFTCTLFFPFEGEQSFATINTEEKALQFFKEVFPDTLDLIPDLAQQYMRNPNASLVLVRCNPWHISDKVVLMGDSAHAIVPFYGQGMNSGFEDCRVLDELIDELHSDYSAIFAEYTRLRQPDGNAIADLALQNFIEMRDLVADESFLLRKKIEKKIYEKHPDKWIPLYSQVTFSPNIRYSDAIANGKRQEKIMDGIMAMNDIASKWDSDEVEQLILNQV